MHTNQDADSLFRGTARVILEQTKTVAKMFAAAISLALIINSLRKK